MAESHTEEAAVGIKNMLQIRSSHLMHFPPFDRLGGPTSRPLHCLPGHVPGLQARICSKKRTARGRICSSPSQATVLVATAANSRLTTVGSRRRASGGWAY